MGGGGVLFSALVSASISIGAVSYDGVIGRFAEMAKGITSASRAELHHHLFPRGVYGRVYIRICPARSTFFCFTVHVGRFSTLGQGIVWDVCFKGYWTP